MTPLTSTHPEPVWLESPLLTRLGFRHAFFTRLGGYSAPPFRSLNFSATVGDSPESVAQNLALAAATLGVKREQLCYLSQVHGRQVVILTEATTTLSDAQAREGDAVVSRQPEIACCVRTADCVPILLAAPESGWVAAIHAGWRGCVNGVVGATLSALREQQAGPLVAAIGPHISLPAFEVSSEVADELRRASPDPDIVDQSGVKPHVDLRRMIRAQLTAGGLASDQIDDVSGCTYLEPERFFSYRRDGAVSGRHLSAIVPSLPQASLKLAPKS